MRKLLAALRRWRKAYDDSWWRVYRERPIRLEQEEAA